MGINAFFTFTIILTQGVRRGNIRQIVFGQAFFSF